MHFPTDYARAAANDFSASSLRQITEHLALVVDHMPDSTPAIERKAFTDSLAGLTALLGWQGPRQTPVPVTETELARVGMEL